MGYLKKDEAALRWDETKRRLRLEGRIVLDRIMNEVLAEADADFGAALLAGKLADVPASREELQAYFRSAAQRILSPRAGGQRALAPKR